MKSLLTVCSDLGMSSLATVALLGLVFPAHLFAQSSWNQAGIQPATSFQIELLEMSRDRTLPSRFALTGGGRDLVFERDAEGYRWHDANQIGVFGRHALPDLAEVLRWQVSLSAEGELRARIPVARLGPSGVGSEALMSSAGVVGSRRLDDTMAEIVGSFDPEARAYALSVLAPGELALDFTISAEHLSAAASLDNGPSSGGSPNGQTVIHIPWAILLSILIRVSCATIHSVCVWACNQVCGEVATVETAACGVGCTCVCE